MKIAFLNLNHMTMGIHNNAVPLGIGLISIYLKKTIKQPLDIKMFNEGEKALDSFKSWVPDVLGISQFCWNSELNLYVAREVKKINPNCIIVAGGPNLGISTKWKTKFLKENNYVDICVSHDGEIPFTEIVKRTLSGESLNFIKKNPSAGTYSIDSEKGVLIESLEPSPRIDSLDVFGSIYVEGIFDEFLKSGYHPFIQTHRGCPFKCVYCSASDPYYSRMMFISPEIFRKDMEYLGKLFTGKHNVRLHLGNTNMSLFNQDFEIAKIIREMQEKYDWPKIINVSSGKDSKKLLDMLSIIKFQPAIALQTLTPKVLENIGRKNIPLDSFCSFQQEVLRMTGETSSTDLILCLPGETKETFLQTLKEVMNSGIQNIVVYTLMSLNGTKLSTDEFINEYGNIIKYRIVPRQFSVLNGEKIFDTEEIVVATKDMPFEDYLDLRGLTFTVAIFFGSSELIPLKRFLLEYNFDIAKWIFNIHKQILDYPELHSIYEDFIRETKEELFPTKEALIEFYQDPKNYEELLSAKRGDNLIRKYNYTVLAENYFSYLKLAIREARKLMYEKMEKGKVDDLINDLEIYLSFRNVKSVLEDNKENSMQSVTLTYDIPNWLELSKECKLLEEFSGSYHYSVKTTEEGQRMINSLISMHKNKDLSSHLLYRDGSTKYLWPTWEKF